VRGFRQTSASPPKLPSPPKPSRRGISGGTLAEKNRGGKTGFPYQARPRQPKLDGMQFRSLPRLLPAALLIILSLGGSVSQLAAAPASIRVITATPGGDRREVTGELVVEARDGSLLVETPTQELQILPGGSIVSRTTAPEPEPLAARELGRRVLANLPDGFDLLTTRHYCICYSTSRSYARWAAALLEQLHRGFYAYFSQLGLAIKPGDEPLVVVIFADRRSYETAATGDVGEASHSVVGYYNQLTNQITTYDISGIGGLHNPQTSGASRAGLAVLSSPRASGLVATLVHEATHQLAFNAGLHQRLAPIPVWLSEGIATFFETPDLTSTRGWRAIGGINQPRLDLVRRRFTPGLLQRMVAGDDPFRDPDEALLAYAHAWAAVSYFTRLRRGEFADYVKLLGDKQPLRRDSAETRCRDFQRAFGAGPDAIEQPLLRYLATLPARRAPASTP